MKKVYWTFPILAIILIAGCTQIQEKIWVGKHLTQCAEEFGGPYSVTNEDIKKFYEEKNIIIYDIKRENVSGAACEACNCLSDVKLYLQVSINDKNYFLEKGFNQTENPIIATKSSTCTPDYVKIGTITNSTLYALGADDYAETCKYGFCKNQYDVTSSKIEMTIFQGEEAADCYCDVNNCNP